MKSSWLERLLEPAAVRRRQHGVAGGGDQGPDLAGARRLDLLGEHGHGQLAAELGEAADAAARLVSKLPGSPPRPVRPTASTAGVVNIEAAELVEVTGEGVEHDEQPRRRGRRTPGWRRPTRP